MTLRKLKRLGFAQAILLISSCLIWGPDARLVTMLGLVIPLLTLAIGAAVRTTGSAPAHPLRLPGWLLLSYTIVGLSETLPGLVAWTITGLLAAGLTLSFDRRLPFETRIPLVAAMGVLFSVCAYCVSQVAHQQTEHRTEMSSRLEQSLDLLEAQIVGGQKWQALLNLPEETRIAIFSSEGVLEFYHGDPSTRRATARLGWTLPTPSGSRHRRDSLILWKKLASGEILLAHHRYPPFPPWLPDLALGFGLSLLVGGLVTAGSSRALSEHLANLKGSLRRDERHWHSTVSHLQRRARERDSQLRRLGQRLDTYRKLQDNLVLEEAFPVLADFLESLGAERTRIWFQDSGRELIVYESSEAMQTAPTRLNVPLEDDRGRVFGRVELNCVSDSHRLFDRLRRGVGRFGTLLQHLNRVREQEQLSRLFHSLLKPDSVDPPHGFSVAHKYLPARLLSGDLIDVFERSPHEHVLVVVDVLGKGIEAALTALRIKELVRLLFLQGKSPSRVATELNSRVCDSGYRMATAILVLVKPLERSLTYCNAGHEAGLLSDGEETTFLKSTGMMAGVLPEASYCERSLPLSPDSRLLLLTDGVTEARNEDGAHFGSQRVRDTFESDQLGAVCLVEKLFQRIRKHCQGKFSDDVSILAITFNDL